jgi:hypothetical protein
MKTVALLPATALLAALLALSACGGGDDAEAPAPAPADTTPPAPSAVQGLWTGSTASGRAVSGIVLNDGTFYLRYSIPDAPALVSGVLQGKAVTGATRWSSPDAKDFSLEATGVQPIAVEGSYTTEAAFGGTVTFADGSTTHFQALYDATYSLPASLDTVAGSYGGSAALLLGALDSTLTIARSGTVTGVLGGCAVNGAVQPRTDANAYSLALTLLTLGPAPCNAAGQSFIGIAYLDASMRRLHVVAPNPARTAALLFEGIKPAQ